MVTATPPDALDILSEIPAEGGAGGVANATTLDVSEISATSELYRAAVGNIHTDRYQRVFDRFEAADRSGPSWNWAAALLTFNWMAFRQLWGAGLVYVGSLVAAAIVVFGLGRLVLHFSDGVEMGLLALFGLLAVTLPGFYGNAIFYAACRNRMASALAANTTVPEACTMLRKMASTRMRLVWLLLANMALAGGIVAIYMAFPDADRLTLNTTRIQDARSEPADQAPALAPQILPAASSPQTTASEPAAIASAPAAMASAPVVAASQPVVLAAEPVVSALEPTPVEATKPDKPSAKQTKVEAKAAIKAKTKTQTSTPSKSTTPSPADKKFYVNVGLFADANNARNAYTKLIDAGLLAIQHEVNGKRGQFTRVQVGPFETQGEAERAADKVRGLNLDAIVQKP